VKKWIQPLEDGALPNVGLRSRMMDMVSKMPGTWTAAGSEPGLGLMVLVQSSRST
jgi:hypothetical protein